MSRVGSISTIIGYKLREIKESGTTAYLCYVRDTGWKIDKYVETGGDLAITTATDHNNSAYDYSGAVTNRATLTYV